MSRASSLRFRTSTMRPILECLEDRMLLATALSAGYGIGVKGDIKYLGDGVSLASPTNPTIPTSLVTYHAASGHGANGAHYDLISTDGDLITYDARNGTRFLYYITDKDNVWNTAAQAAAVDAQFYASKTVAYYSEVLHYDISHVWSVVHYARNYQNAFFDGAYMVYGDGSPGSKFNQYDDTRAFSAAVDVVAHELTHGVTDSRAPLNYKNQSGALNESFSDIMGTVVEWWYLDKLTGDVEKVLDSNGNTTATYGQDWLLGEDLFIKSPAGQQQAVRSMSNPHAFGQPDHMSEYYITNSDNGGVHTNSGIPNHAFYLLVVGQSESTPGIGMDAAAKIFFEGFGELTFNATFSEARDRTVEAALEFFPDYAQSVSDAWAAVGVTGTVIVTQSGSGSGVVGGLDAGSEVEGSSLTLAPEYQGLEGADPREVVAGNWTGVRIVAVSVTQIGLNPSSGNRPLVEAGSVTVAALALAPTSGPRGGTFGLLTGAIEDGQGQAALVADAGTDARDAKSDAFSGAWIETPVSSTAPPRFENAVQLETLIQASSEPTSVATDWLRASDCVFAESTDAMGFARAGETDVMWGLLTALAGVVLMQGCGNRRGQTQEPDPRMYWL